jgi:hypothetical protein
MKSTDAQPLLVPSFFSTGLRRIPYIQWWEKKFCGWGIKLGAHQW